jgi:hypothetical protein
MEITFTTLEQQLEQSDINICGTLCVGDCHTCVQSNADLRAFYGLPQEPATEVEVMAAESQRQTSVLEAAEALDAVEEAQRSGEAYDYDYDCECDECLYDDRDDYEDDNCGISWNESGYFD